jgi:hypothetical protein
VIFAVRKALLHQAFAEFEPKRSSTRKQFRRNDLARPVIKRNAQYQETRIQSELNLISTVGGNR